MKHITVSSIEKAISKVDNLDEDGLEKLAETNKQYDGLKISLENKNTRWEQLAEGIEELE